MSRGAFQKFTNREIEHRTLLFHKKIVLIFESKVTDKITFTFISTEYLIFFRLEKGLNHSTRRSLDVEDVLVKRQSSVARCFCGKSLTETDTAEASSSLVEIRRMCAHPKCALHPLKIPRIQPLRVYVSTPPKNYPTDQPPNPLKSWCVEYAMSETFRSVLSPQFRWCVITVVVEPHAKEPFASGAKIGEAGPYRPYPVSELSSIPQQRDLLSTIKYYNSVIIFAFLPFSTKNSDNCCAPAFPGQKIYNTWHAM